jgi:chitin-binding protein
MNKFLLVWVMWTVAQITYAHGTLSYPPSRALLCVQDASTSACQAIIETYGEQTIGNPNGILRTESVENDQDIVADGRLCSGNIEHYKGLDEVRDDWQATEITADVDGNIELFFSQFITHGTREYIYYITDEGYNNEALSWNNVSEFCRKNSSEVSNYKMQCTLPERTGKHVIYGIWHSAQPDYSFYACSDVMFLTSDVTPTVMPTSMITPTMIPSMAPSVWYQEKKWGANEVLSQFSIVNFTLFDQNDRELEQHSLEINEQNTQPSQWGEELAELINVSSNAVQIGVLNAQQQVILNSTMQDNSVYVANNIHHSLLSFEYATSTPTAVITDIPAAAITPTSEPKDNKLGNLSSLLIIVLMGLVLFRPRLL